MLNQKTIEKIHFIYSTEQAGPLIAQLEHLLKEYTNSQRLDKGQLSGQDVFLITYADSVCQENGPGLQSFGRFYERYLQEIISIVHFLPFFPWTSDDGFSVVDYRSIDPALGNWDNVRSLAEKVDLCFDFVLNHCSSQSEYFQGFLADDPRYKDFFITEDSEADYSAVLRPRTSPLFHEFDSASGPRKVWTTFSRDQVDLNFQNPAVLLEMIDILLFFVKNGTRMLRLDAIAYLWKKLGTSCAHLPQTHAVVQLMRAILDDVAPHVLLLTETNVLHRENISYFGDGSNEAQLVYNFPLPPLILHTLTAQEATKLTAWAKTIEPVSDRTTFLNFTASHDGIGVRPAADILPPDEFQKLIDLATTHGGQVSYKTDADGRAVPYELNINWLDAINNPNIPNADRETAIQRFLLSQSMALTFLGMPAIYIHSLLGSRNWYEGVAQTGRARSINREKLDLPLLEKELLDPTSLRHQVYQRYRELIRLRRVQPAFAPGASQQILDFGSAVFANRRMAENQTILAIHNVTAVPQTITLRKEHRTLAETIPVTDLISGNHYDSTLALAPFQFLWLTL